MLNTPVARRSLPTSSLPRLSGANDNSRLRLVPPSARGAVGRFQPINKYLGVVGLALTALNYLSQPKQDHWTNLGPWSIWAQIPNHLRDPNYNGAWGNLVNTSVPNSSAAYNAVTRGQKLLSIDNLGNPWGNVTNNHRTVTFGKANATPRGQANISFTRPNQGAFVKPTFVPASPAIALPPNPAITVQVTINPMNAKPGQAPAFTRPIPWSALPSTQPSTGREASNGEKDPFAEPTAPYYSSQVPNDWSTSVDLIPQGQAGQSAPKTHDLSPPNSKPPKNEKEVKHKLPTAAIAVLKAVNAVTEGIDFVDALYKALPSEYRPRYRNSKHEKRSTNPAERMEAVIKHGDKIDIYEAIDNLVANQVEDYVFGKFGKAQGEVSRNAGLNYGMGLNTINRKFSKSTYEFERGKKLSVYGG